MDQATFEGHVSKYIKLKTDEDKDLLQSFLKLCSYQDGQYDRDSDFQRLEQRLGEVEKVSGAAERLFYMALPPSVFIPVAESLKKNNYRDGITTRLIVEKPFGLDLESSRKLAKELGALFSEEEVSQLEML
jgi:glucose-6-phosphate 1-dehydrogenase